MSEWLDLMLGEIERKNRERKAALDELERRKAGTEPQAPDGSADDDSPADADGK